jgi:hypothetical protein
MWLNAIGHNDNVFHIRYSKTIVVNLCGVICDLFDIGPSNLSCLFGPAMSQHLVLSFSKEKKRKEKKRKEKKRALKSLH